MKIFRDPIYGYIPICKNYCEDFIDTSILQRLRRIEQTSMRILYPSAHHDRFAHSIGVFHLGQIAFDNLKTNSEKYFKEEVSEDQWQYYKATFEIACLLHDCGHSPFSHTFEHYYLLGNEDKVEKEILNYFSDCETFIDEYREASPAPHEKISALLLLRIFSDKISSKYSASPQLAARMIMGCKHYDPSNVTTKIENKLISLLNGSGIDVDSLDYIQRDSWASGVCNVDIDYQRLLSSLMIKPGNHGNPEIVFKKNVLSVIDNISIGRNFLYKWIYSHHIVSYEQYLMGHIVEKINSDSKNKLKNSMFSINSFFETTKFNNFTYYLPSDDDLMHTIKCFIDSDPMIKELISRKYKYKAIWKTYFEFNETYFHDISLDNRMKISAKLKKGTLNKKYGKNSIMCIDAKPKLKGIKPNDFFVLVGDRLIDASKATSSSESQNLNYFYVYVLPELLSKKEEIITNILSLGD